MARLIAFVGYQRSGKTTCAKILRDDFYFFRSRFAQRVRDMLTPLLPARSVDYWLDGEGKNLPCPHFGGKTPVEAMQTLGTDWGRYQLYDNLWVDQWANDIDLDDDNVVDDARFPNEVKKIRELGGEIWRVYRPGFERASTHESEDYVDSIEPDRVIVNSGSIDDLRRRLDVLING